MLLALDMTTLIESFEPEKQFALLVIVVGCLTGIVITTVLAVLGTANAIHRRKTDDQLKRDMLGMGMEANEIAQVVEASSPESDDDSGGASKNVYAESGPNR